MVLLTQLRLALNCSNTPASVSQMQRLKAVKIPTDLNTISEKVRFGNICITHEPKVSHQTTNSEHNSFPKLQHKIQTPHNSAVK